VQDHHDELVSFNARLRKHRSVTQPSGALQRMRARGATCENFLYSFKVGLAADAGEGGPQRLTQKLS
jgi:hypothetical protein